MEAAVAHEAAQVVPGVQRFVEGLHIELMPLAGGHGVAHAPDLFKGAVGVGHHLAPIQQLEVMFLGTHRAPPF